jgi:O-methyltransferase
MNVLARRTYPRAWKKVNDGMAEQTIELKEVKKPKQKFNASLSFSHRPPYDPLFAERIPVLQAFQIALANYLSARKQPKGWRRLASFLDRQDSRFQAVECGVYTGSSLLACAELARASGLDFRMIGLDTFTGLPPLSKTDREFAPQGAKYLEETFFTDTSIEAVQEKVRSAGLEKRIELKKGLFSDTLPLLGEQRYHFVNVDCDLYEPHLECLEYFYPRMVCGGVLFFDDYHSVNYPMARKAIDRFMKGKPEVLSHLRFGPDAANRTKAFLIKY